MAKKNEITVEDAIAQFEVRIEGLYPKDGEKVIVTNLRQRSNAYIADLTKVFNKHTRDGRDAVLEPDEDDFYSVRSRDVIYLKDYIDLLRERPVLNVVKEI